MDALPIVRFRLQTSDGSRWWRADCDWAQLTPNLLQLNIDAIMLLDADNVVWTVAAVAEVAGLSVEAVVYTMRRALAVVAAARMRDETRLPRVTLPRGADVRVIEGRLAS